MASQDLDTWWSDHPYLQAMEFGPLEGVPQPYLGDVLTMVINRLLTGMILQVLTSLWPFGPADSSAEVTWKRPVVRQAPRLEIWFKLSHEEKSETSEIWHRYPKQPYLKGDTFWILK